MTVLCKELHVAATRLRDRCGSADGRGLGSTGRRAGGSNGGGGAGAAATALDEAEISPLVTGLVDLVAFCVTGSLPTRRSSAAAEAALRPGSLPLPDIPADEAPEGLY